MSKPPAGSDPCPRCGQPLDIAPVTRDGDEWVHRTCAEEES